MRLYIAGEQGESGDQESSSVAPMAEPLKARAEQGSSPRPFLSLGLRPVKPECTHFSRGCSYLTFRVLPMWSLQLSLKQRGG